MNKKNYIEEISWPEARNDVMHADASFAKLVDDLNPDKSFTLVKVKYPFGFNILENLAFYLPEENGQSVTLEQTELPAKIRNKLNYNLIPLGIVVKNNVEVYKELGDKVFSLAFYGNGLDIGIWEYFGQSR